MPDPITAAAANSGFFEAIEQIRFLDIKLLDVDDFFNLLLRFLFNFTMVIIVARYIYYPVRRDKNYLFTFVIFNTLVFFICYLLNGVKIEMGFAFGIFALFSLLRYRTFPLPVKEMTYLFAVIIIAVVNALSTKKVSYAELFFTNFMIVGLIYYLDRMWLTFRGAVQVVTYENIDNIKPENRSKLLADLKERTGLDIIGVEIDKINFLNDTARITINYEPKDDNVLTESVRKADVSKMEN